MSSISTSERVQVLLGQAIELIRHDNLRQASEPLREATSLEPDNVKVKEAWKTLQSSESHGPLLLLLRSFVQNDNENDGKKALEVLRQRQISPDDAVEAVQLILEATGSSVLLDSLTGTLLNRNLAVRSIFVQRFQDNNVTNDFNNFWERGADSFNAITAIPLDDVAWTSKDAQSTAQCDIFNLCESMMLEAGIEHQEKAMKAIARQLATAPENVKPLLDEDLFDAVLSALDIRHKVSLRSQAMLATSKLLETTKEEGEAIFANFITSHVARQHIDDLIIAFSAASAAFPIIPAVAAKLFLTESFLEHLVVLLEKHESQRLEQAALELMSAACVDKACREAVQKQATDWLQLVEGAHKGLATLVLSKISAGEGDVSAQLSALVLSDKKEESEQAIEGLAYTSLQPKVKEVIALNGALLGKLVEQLKASKASTFGALTVLANVTAYKSPLSDEQKKMSQLKAYANAAKPTNSEDPLDEDKHVTARCRKVLDAGAVPALVAPSKTASATATGLTVQILLSLAKEQKHRATMAQQGAIKLLLQSLSKLPSSDTSRNASHALARILISVNPSHVFTSGLPASSAAAPLVALLKPDETGEQRDLLPMFESLLALTNLASMEDDSIRELIIRQAWTRLEDLLLSNNTLIQRASVELVCNLMASPTCVAKFADGSKPASNRMHILLALADVEDLATRRAAGGALAMLTEWDAAVEAVLSKARGVKIILGLCDDDSDELRHRGVACLANVVSAPGDAGTKGIAKVKEEGGVETLKEMLRKTKDPTILSIGISALKKLV